jgi:hypothetical protein
MTLRTLRYACRGEMVPRILLVYEGKPELSVVAESSARDAK